jgi:hypothetical protein
MDQWEDLDLLEPAHITFIGKDSGELAVVAVAADLDVRYGSRNGSACVEFSWEGSDDNSMPADAVGPRSALLIDWSVTSSSTKATTQISSPNASDFFNSLLDSQL